MRNAFLIFMILLLSSTVHAQDCTGVIINPILTIDGDDMEVEVTFQNTGSVDCEFRVFLFKSNGEIVDKEPDLYWGDFYPGETGSYTVSGSVGEFGDNTYWIELRDQHGGMVDAQTGTLPDTPDITPPGQGVITTTTISTGAYHGTPTDYLGRFEYLVTILLCLLIYLTPPVVLFMLVLGGIRFMSDDPLKRKEGKGVITLAIGGAVGVMVLLAVASLIAGIDVGMCWTATEPQGCISNGGKCMTLECSNYTDCSVLSYVCDGGKHCCTGGCTGGELEVAIISPPDASAFKMGDEIVFDSSVSGGTPPYSYSFKINEVTDVVGNYIQYVDCNCIHNWPSSDEIEVAVYVMNPGNSEATFDVCVGTHCESITLDAKEDSSVTIDSNWEAWALPSLAGSFDVTVKSGGGTLETYGPVNVPLSVDSDGDCCNKYDVTIEPPRDGGLVVKEVHAQEEKSFSKNDLSLGNYLVALTVTDSQGEEGASSINMKVAPFTVRIESPRAERFLEGEPVTFSASVDGGRAPYHYRWFSWLDGILNDGQVDVGDTIDIPDFSRSDLSEGYHLFQLEVIAYVGDGTILYTVRDMNSFVIYSEPKYTYIYVPVGSWGSQEEFEDKAKARQDFFVDISPLKDCKAEVMNATIYLDLEWTNDNCGFNQTSLVWNIKTCADEYASSNGITYERAVGLSSEHLYPDYGYTTLGYKAVYSELSVGLGNATPPIPEKEVLSVPAHELGHTYYLCDEYSYSLWVNRDYPCPNRWPQECPVFDHECAGVSSKCCGETPTFRDYLGSYTAGGTQCPSETTYSVMGFFATWHQCGYGVSSYEYLENFLECHP